MDVPPTSEPAEEVPQRPWGSDGTPSEFPRTAARSDGRFNKEEWEGVFQDPAWIQPVPGANPPSPVKEEGRVRLRIGRQLLPKSSRMW